MKTILLLSDTHGYIGEEMLRHAKEADELWHAGDIGNLQVAQALKKVLKKESIFRAVYGNIDSAEIRTEYPLHNRFWCEGVEVWITHIGGYPNRYAPQIRSQLKANPPKLFISGHSHILKVMPDAKLGLLHMNPGAIGKHGFHKVRTMLKFKIDGERIFDLTIIEYPR